MIEFKSKIGSNRNAARVWIEGKRLLKMGWKKGDRFSATFNKNGIAYVKDPEGPRKVAGTEERPIIDTNTNLMTSFITAGEMATIKIYEDSIFISNPK